MSAALKPSGLPDYENPPLNEVACGIGFTPLASLRTAHIGRYWESVKERYPATEDAPPLATEGDLLLNPATGLPPPRVWFLNQSLSRLIQLQHNKLYVNWRARDGELKYPRFPEIIADFNWALDSLKRLIEANQLEPLNTEECDLTYINHLDVPKGTPLESFISYAFRDFHWTQGDRFLPRPDVLSWRAHFPMPESRGHLSVRLYHATKREGGDAILVYELAAKGAPRTSSPDALTDWFAGAREMIVRGFSDMTTPEAQRELWRRRS